MMMWMIQCDVCDGWLHWDCSGLTEENDEEYICQKCDPVEDS